MLGKDLLFVSQKSRGLVTGRENSGVFCSHQQTNPWAFPLKKQMNITAKHRPRPPSSPQGLPPGPTDTVAGAMFPFLHAPLARELSVP